MKKKYMVFTVQAYEIAMTDGQLMDNVTLELICKTADEALTRAKKIITKKEYRIARVFENFEHASA